MCDEKRKRLGTAQAELERMGPAGGSSGGGGLGGMLRGLVSWGHPNTPRGTIRALEGELDSLAGLARWVRLLFLWGHTVRGRPQVADGCLVLAARYCIFG